MLSQCAKRCLPLAHQIVPQVQILSRSAYQIPGNSNNYDTVWLFGYFIDSIEGNGCNCRIERSENLQVTDYEGGLCIDISISILSL